jgi:hypothetical protein
MRLDNGSPAARQELFQAFHRASGLFTHSRHGASGQFTHPACSTSLQAEKFFCCDFSQTRRAAKSIRLFSALNRLNQVV